MKPSLFVIGALLVSAFVHCSRSSSQSSEAAAPDSAVTLSDTVSQQAVATSAPVANLEGINFPLDSLRAYTNEEALVAAFGRQNVLHQEDGATLFPGTNREVDFQNDQEGGFAMFTAKETTAWQLKNGLRIGMTITEVIDLNKSGFAFDKKFGHSGSAGGALESGFEGWGFTVPKEITDNNKYGEWITYDELAVEDRPKVKLGFIMVYYEDQSVGG